MLKTLRSGTPHFKWTLERKEKKNKEKEREEKIQNKKLKPPQRVKAAGSEVKQLRLSVNWWKLNNNVGIETRHKRTR